MIERLSRPLWRRKNDAKATELTRRIVAWAEANDLEPHLIPQDRLWLEDDTIHYHEVVKPGEDVPGAFPSDPYDEFAVWITPERTKPLHDHPNNYGIETLEFDL